MSHWEYLKQMQVSELAEFLFESVCMIIVVISALIIVKYAVLGVMLSTSVAENPVVK